MEDRGACHRRLIRAQTAASAWLTCLSLDFAKTRELGVAIIGKEKLGVSERHSALRMRSCLISRTLDAEDCDLALFGT